MAMKASGADEELSTSESAAGELGVQLESDLALTLPAVSDAAMSEPSASRRLLVYRKNFPTRPRYPRRTLEIKATAV